MTGCTSGGYDQLETSPETLEQELRPAVCERRQGDNKVVLLVLIDLSAAFDTVNHERLLSTLHAIGITGKALAWFTSYLQNRSQTITINGKQSRSQQLECGVPQGSVIGPILFNIYTAALGLLLRQEKTNYSM